MLTALEQLLCVPLGDQELLRKDVELQMQLFKGKLGLNDLLFCCG